MFDNDSTISAIIDFVDLTTNTLLSPSITGYSGSEPVSNEASSILLVTSLLLKSNELIEFELQFTKTRVKIINWNNR